MRHRIAFGFATAQVLVAPLRAPDVVSGAVVIRPAIPPGPVALLVRHRHALAVVRGPIIVVLTPLRVLIVVIAVIVREEWNRLRLEGRAGCRQ
jgi:hypothetical protein